MAATVAMPAGTITHFDLFHHLAPGKHAGSGRYSGSFGRDILFDARRPDRNAARG